MSHIFISYSHKDKEYVYKLREALQNEGFDIWIDDRIDFGTTWPKVIQENLDACSAFIVVMTEDAYASKWVHNEVTRAERKGKPFFALLLSGDTWLSLEAIQYEKVIGGKLPSRKFYETLAQAMLQKESLPHTPIPEQPLTPKDTIVRFVSKILPLAKLLGILLFVGSIIWIVSSKIQAISSFIPTATANTTLTFVPRTMTPTQRFATPSSLEPSLTPAETAVLTPSPQQPSFTAISVVESFSSPGLHAEGITWDGTYLWLSDNSGLMFKMDVSGKVLDNFAAPEVTPQGLTWDGSSFWMFTTNYFLIYQFQIENGKSETISTFPSPGELVGGDITQDMAWDGTSLWYANQFKVFHLDTSGKMLSSFVFPKNVTGLDWDGSNLWLAHNDFPNNATLVKVSTEGDVLDSYPSPILEINGLAWVDGDLWALGLNSIGDKPTIYKLNIPRTYLSILSEEGDYVGQGQILELNTTDYDFSVRLDTPYELAFQIDDGRTSWDISFAPPRGQVLDVGHYEGAERTSFKHFQSPGFEFYGDQRGCNEIQAEFDVLKLERDADGNLIVFEADFVQYCDGSQAALRGKLRFYSQADGN